MGIKGKCPCTSLSFEGILPLSLLSISFEASAICPCIAYNSISVVELEAICKLAQWQIASLMSPTLVSFGITLG